MENINTYTQIDNYRVVVTSNAIPQHEKSVCNEIMNQIKRHVDNVYNVTIECDTEQLCVYCYKTPEPDENGCPQCCEKAIDYFYEQIKSGKQIGEK